MSKPTTPPVLVRKFCVTPANVHDITPLFEMVEEKDRDTGLHAHSAYKSAETDHRLEEFGNRNHIHEKGTRAAKLTAEQKA